MTDFPDDAARIVRQAERLARLNALLECRGIISRRALDAIGTPGYAHEKRTATALTAEIDARVDAMVSAQKEAA